MNIRKAEIIIFAITLFSFILGIHFHPQMPDEVVTRWDFQGQPSGYMPKFWGVFVIPFIIAGIVLFFIAAPRLGLLKVPFLNIEKSEKYYYGFVILFLLFLFLIHLYIILWNIGIEMNPFVIIAIGLSPLVLYVGVLCINVKKLFDVEKLKRAINWRLFWILLAASNLGVIAVIPYLLTLQAPHLKGLFLPLYVLLPIQIIQNVILFSFSIFVGLYLSKKVNLGIPILEGWLEGKEVKTYLKSILGISVISGVLVGSLLIGIDSWLHTLQPITITLITPPIWQSFLASFYGGISEEVLCRLFLMTLLVWISCKVKKTEDGRPTDLGIWIAIIVTAILFGIGHLPVTSTLTQLTPFVVARTIVLNGIAGIVFGWLYWKKGLESAMISHFSANIILHVVFPSFT